MRNTVERIANAIDRAIAAIGRAAAWCCLYVVIVEFAVVVMRYVLGIGSIKLQESVLYAHAGLFMLAAAWTLQVDGHVRVDIFYAQAKPRTRALIDLIGALRLPFAVRRGARSCCRCPMWSAPGPFLNARARRADCRSSICSRRSFRCLPSSSACKAWRRRSAPRWC